VKSAIQCCDERQIKEKERENKGRKRQKNDERIKENKRE
jgi:hypothetical protein